MVFLNLLQFRHPAWSFVPLACCISFAAHADESAINFNRDIRPLLSENCYHCHGPDDEHRQADLRLDTEEGIKAAFEGGQEKSDAWQRIVSTDPDLVMPPADSHKELEPEDIKTLGAWVAAGATWAGPIKSTQCHQR